MSSCRSRSSCGSTARGSRRHLRGVAMFGREPRQVRRVSIVSSSRLPVSRATFSASAVGLVGGGRIGVDLMGRTRRAPSRCSAGFSVTRSAWRKSSEASIASSLAPHGQCHRQVCPWQVCGRCALRYHVAARVDPSLRLPVIRYMPPSSPAKSNGTSSKCPLSTAMQSRPRRTAIASSDRPAA